MEVLDFIQKHVSVLLSLFKIWIWEIKSNPKTVKQFKYEKISLIKKNNYHHKEKSIRKPITNDAVNGGSRRQKEHHLCGGTKTFSFLSSEMCILPS